MKRTEYAQLLKDKIMQKLIDREMWWMVESIHVDIDCADGAHCPEFANINIKLIGGLCFPPCYLENVQVFSKMVDTGDELNAKTFATSKSIDREMEYIAADLINSMQNVGPFQRPLWIDQIDYKSPEQENLDSTSLALFGIPYDKTNNKQRWMVFQYACAERVITAERLVELVDEFVQKNQRALYRKDQLWQACDYARKYTKILSDDDMEIISQIRFDGNRIVAKQRLEQLRSFCINNKRWFYKTEKEMVDCIYAMAQFYKYRVYNADELQEIDNLYNAYAHNDSKGELAVNEYLIELGYQIKKQFKFDDCKDRAPLPFDTMFYIGNQMCLVEFDGRQHFESIAHFGGDGYLSYVQHHDEIKNQYCNKNNIPLLRIRFDEIKSVKSLIDAFIGEIKMKCEV